MKAIIMRQLLWPVTLAAVFLSACSFSPQARKQKYMQSGQAYFAKGDYSAASIQFANAVKLDPSYADAHLRLAESYMLLQQNGRAFAEYSRTIELRPDDYRARIALVNLLISSRNYTKAKEQLDTLQKQRPNDPAVHSALASLWAGQGNIPAAIHETQQTIALAPGDWQPYLSLALLQLKNNQLDAAEANFKQVIAMDPKEAQGRVLLAAYYQSRNRDTEAEQELRQAITADPANMLPRGALAKLYLAEGKKSEAENLLLQARRDLPHNPDSFLAMSNFYFVMGDLDKAVAEYRALIQERPTDAIVKKKFIQLLIAARHYDEAARLNGELLKQNPNDIDALVYRGQILISKGDVDDAVQTLQTAAKNSPDDSQAHYALGVAFDKQGYSQRAESEWREAIRLNPDYLDPQRAIANQALHTGDMNALQDAANQIIRLQPQSPEGYALRAIASMNRNNLDAAERDVNRAIAIAPQNAFGYAQLGNLRFAQKRYGDAVNSYQDALSRNSASTDALRGLMKAYLAMKQPAKAIAAAKMQIGKLPNNSSFYDLLGEALFHIEKDFDGAEVAFKKSIILDSHNSDAVIQLCQVQAQKGQIDQAIATGEQSLKQNSRDPELDIVLGDLYVAKSNWQAAQSAYQRALAINSLNAVASNDLANVMLHMGGNLDAALSLAQTASREMPGSSAAADTIGWIYYQRGEYQLALNSLQLALSLAETNQASPNPDIHYHLGMTYAKIKQLTLARQHFEKALAANPGYQKALEIKAELARLQS